jgi:hypothetical protein
MVAGEAPDPPAASRGGITQKDGRSGFRIIKELRE